MEKTLYFPVPRFGRWKIEQKIVNELDAPCYRVTNKYTKQFANDDMWIVLVNICKNDLQIDLEKLNKGNYTNKRK